MAHYTLSLPDEAATLHLGESFAQCMTPPCVIYLQGDLGAGKTTFSRGFLHGCGHSGVVKSPTYTLVESYSFGDKVVHHMDLYRFLSAEEWIEAGLDDLLTNQAIILLEWPQKGAGVIPPSDIDIQLSMQNQGRMCTIMPNSTIGELCFSKWLNLQEENS